MEVSMSFWKELSRRNVVRVGIAYAVAAWLIIHPVDIVFPILHLPEWSITLIAALLIIAFPFVLLFSWVYEITPKGLKRTKDVPLSKSITHLTGKRLNFIITGLLVVALAYFVFDKYFIGRGAVETKQVPAVSDVEKSKKTIAVIPFVNLSSDKEQEYFVDGLSEELLNTLTQIQDLLVTARTSSFTFKNSNKKVQEIANELGVENILEGSVRKSGNELRISAQLIRAKDGFHLWSKTYEHELKDIFRIQEDIAAAVADELKVTLGLKQLGGTDNVKAYELYLVAQGQTVTVDQEIVSRALKSLNAAIALDPRFALAWAAKANIHSVLARLGPVSHADAEKDAALQAAQKAIELEPNLSEAYASLGAIRSSRGEFLEAGSAYQKALELTTESLGSMSGYIPHHIRPK
jgi:TolB-like protein